MDTKNILTNCLLNIQPNTCDILNKYNKNIAEFIDILAKFKNYSLTTELSMSNSSVSKLLTELLPNRIKSNTKLHTYILSINGLKYCNQCSTILPISEFYKNSTRLDGLSSCCTMCQKKLFNDWYTTSNGAISKIHSACRRARIKLACPSWANIAKIKEVYKNCPGGMEVDHIVPLNGTHVCGLHVETNLQYLSKVDNIKKSNKF